MTRNASKPIASKPVKSVPLDDTDKLVEDPYEIISNRPDKICTVEGRT